MDDNNTYCVMNANFLLTNNSTDTNQESNSVYQATNLINLTAGMEVLMYFSRLL